MENHLGRPPGGIAVCSLREPSATVIGAVPAVKPLARHHRARKEDLNWPNASTRW